MEKEHTQSIKNIYDIKEQTTFSTLRESSDNIVLISNDNSTIARISKRLPSTDVAFECDVLEHLYSNGVLVPRIYPTKKGEKFAILDSGQAVVLFDVIDGSVVKVDAQTYPYFSQAHQAGIMLKKIHDAGLTFSSKNLRSRTMTTELERLLKKKD